MNFKLMSDYEPRGDQPEAIEQLSRGIEAGEKHQVLLGVTGSGKTFTAAKVIERANRPVLVLAHNKTLAAQLYSEFKSFFPQNAVEYFVSYYDFYQPEAYLPASDTYIEKESTINDELDKLRMSATRSLFERRDVVVVASVSCIYGIGSPEAYYGMLLMVEKGQSTNREAMLRKLVEMQYQRAEDLRRGTFRVRGDRLEIYPPYEDNGYAVELWGDQVDAIRQIDPLTGEVRSGQNDLSRLTVYPKSHYVMPAAQRERAIKTILEELDWWKPELERQGKYAEAQRVWQRTMFDIEMMRTIGYCHGIENYSRHMSGRLPGEAPPTLLDYFPQDYLLFIDESHQTVPQLHAMYHGDRSRKQTLVNYGFRMPSALDNRPLNFEEFEHRTGQVLYVSATPGPYELTRSAGVVVEQVIRPTGLVDPQIEVRPVKGQVDDLLEEIRLRAERNERVLVTTLTKRMSEDLAEYFTETGVRCRYMHSEIDTLERVRILRDLRRGEFDVLIGINLLARGPRPARSFARRHPRRRQGRLPAQRDRAHSDDGPLRAPRRRPRHPLRRPHDRLDGPGHRGNQPPPRQASRLQRSERHHANVHHQVRGHEAGRDRGSRLRHRARRGFCRRRHHQRNEAGRSSRAARSANARSRQKIRVRARRRPARPHPHAKTARPLRLLFRRERTCDCRTDSWPEIQHSGPALQVVVMMKFKVQFRLS